MLLNCKNNKFTYMYMYMYVMHCLEMDTEHHIGTVIFWALFFFWPTLIFSVSEATHEFDFSIIKHNLS